MILWGRIPPTHYQPYLHETGNKKGLHLLYKYSEDERMLFYFNARIAQRERERNDYIQPHLFFHRRSGYSSLINVLKFQRLIFFSEPLFKVTEHSN